MEADEKTAKDLDELHALSLRDRKKDSRVERYVDEMYNKWVHSKNRITCLAILGWQKWEAVDMLCEMIEKLPELRKQYENEIKTHGGKPILRDEDVEKYESEARKQFL